MERGCFPRTERLSPIGTEACHPRIDVTSVNESTNMFFAGNKGASRSS